MKLKTKANTKGQMMESNAAVVEQANKHQSWKPILTLITHVKLPWFWILLAVVIELFGSKLTLMFPNYTMRIFGGEFTTELAVKTVAVSLGKALLLAAFMAVSQFTTAKNRYCLQTSVWDRLSQLPMSFFQKNEPRELITRVTTDLDGIADYLGDNLATVISKIYTFFGSIAILATYDWRLAAALIAILPFSWLLTWISGRIYFSLNNRIQGRISDLARYLAAIMPNLSLAKLFGQENREEQNGMSWIFNDYKATLDNEIIQRALSACSALVNLVRKLVVIFVGVWLIREGAIDVAVWIAFYQYAEIFYTSFTNMMGQWEALKRQQGKLARVAAVMEAESEANPGARDAKAADGAIAFEDVTFGYDEDKNVLENVSFTVEPGRFTAIVGPSGAGKSTILNLIERFYDPKNGRITLAGEAAQSYELSSWRQSLGLISQKTHLFSGTIRDNITYGVEGQVTEAQLMEAARGADALEFIQAMPDGFDTQVGERGCKLSGGQRQRIAIARALIKDAKVLVLDEATANLDAESEQNVNDTLARLSRDHTILMVAHHMDAVRNADKIVVLENGHVAGQGSHDQLMAGCKLYRRMVELQSAGAAV